MHFPFSSFLLVVLCLNLPIVHTTCESGWASYEGNCYYLDEDFAFYTYQDCFDLCSNAIPGQNTMMFCIQSGGQNDFISGLATGSDYIWMGYQYSESDSAYVWEDGCTSSFTNWNPGYPRNAGCAYLASSLGTWLDNECSLPIWCGCQYTPGISVSPSTIPTSIPTEQPSIATAYPSSHPTDHPTLLPSSAPSYAPTSSRPTSLPTVSPSSVSTSSQPSVPPSMMSEENDSNNDSNSTFFPFHLQFLEGIYIISGVILLCCGGFFFYRWCIKRKRSEENLSLLNIDNKAFR